MPVRNGEPNTVHHDGGEANKDEGALTQQGDDTIGDQHQKTHDVGDDGEGESNAVTLDVFFWRVLWGGAANNTNPTQKCAVLVLKGVNCHQRDRTREWW